METALAAGGGACAKDEGGTTVTDGGTSGEVGGDTAVTDGETSGEVGGDPAVTDGETSGEGGGYDAALTGGGVSREGVGDVWRNDVVLIEVAARVWMGSDDTTVLMKL